MRVREKEERGVGVRRGRRDWERRVVGSFMVGVVGKDRGGGNGCCSSVCIIAVIILG